MHIVSNKKGDVLHREYRPKYKLTGYTCTKEILFVEWNENAQGNEAFLTHSDDMDNYHRKSGPEG